MDIDEKRFERLVIALENATNALNRFASGVEKKGKRIDGSIKRRVRPAVDNDAEHISDSVRIQVDRALKRAGR